MTDPNDFERRLLKIGDRLRNEGRSFATAEESEERPLSAAEQSAMAWRYQLSLCRVPQRYHRVPPDLPIPPQFAGWFDREWALTLLGPTGCGKTWLAVRLLCMLSSSDRRGRFVDASLAVEEIKGSIGSETRSDLLRELATMPVLLLDDVGAEWRQRKDSASRGTDYQQEQINLILRARYNAELPTIVTGNADSLDEIVSPPVASRLAASVFPIRGRDRRLNEAGR